MARTFYNPYEKDPISTEARVTSNKIIQNFNLDLSDLPATSSIRHFVVSGTNGASFSLEIKNEDSYYYNFTTNTFQAAKARLENKTISSGGYRGSITFPTITDDDHYDIYLFAEGDTKHAPYREVRFGDGTIDINSSIGSNSSLVKKIIYQYTDITLTLATYNPTSAFTIGSLVNDTFTLSRDKKGVKLPFTISCTSASGASFNIKKQPTENEILSFVERTVGSDPEKLPGENEYPTSRAAFTGDDVNGAVTSGQVVRMDNTDLSAAIEVGDKITTVVTTDTVNGAVTSGVTVVMDVADCATIMAVGDRVTGNANLDARVYTVASIGTGGNSNKFNLSSAVAIADGITLTFSSQINRETTTVTVVETSGTATDFTMSQAVQLRDNAPLTFWPRKNHQWPLDSIDKLTEGMIVVPSTNVTADTNISKYKDTVTIFTDTEDERKIIKNEAPALDTKSKTPTVVKGLVTVQPGNVVFNKQQKLALAGDTIKIGGYGTSQVLNVFGYEIKFTDLAVALTPITTTTTAASYSSTNVVVAARDGIMNSVSTVSGIGIDPSAVAPTVSSGANATGAGTIVLSAAQTLENGITLTFPGAGKVATITGNIEIIKTGTADATLRFDVEKLLTSA
tara:strand:- start:405 stop:2276 length:1872 start_codon:yes stop_codon:yes gene_type:complete